MGLLDSALPTQGGPAPDRFWDRFRAEFAPGAYQAHKDSLREQATYAGMNEFSKNNPGQAMAMALNPQYFAAAQGAYLPAAPQVSQMTNAEGQVIPIQVRNPGGPAGHTLTGGNIPVDEGDVTPQVGGGATAPPAPGAVVPNVTSGGAAPAAGAPSLGGGVAPPATPGVRRTLSNLPGGMGDAKALIKQAAENGDPEALDAAWSKVPQGDLAKAVFDNRMSLSEIKQTKGEHPANTVRQLVLAANPSFNELKNEKAGSYVKSYMGSEPNTIGGQLTALGTSLHHINDSAGRQLDIDNRDANFAAGATGANKITGMFGEKANKIGGQNLAIKTASDEIAKFLTGKAPAEGTLSEYHQAFPTPFDTPRVAGEKYNALADLVEKRMNEMESKRDENFSNKKVAQDYPIGSDKHRQAIKELRSKASELKRRGGWQASHDPSTPIPEGGEKEGGLPAGWKYVPPEAK